MEESRDESGPDTYRQGLNRESALYVVGVGASAGGLEALEQLFGAMPEDTGMAFVVIQHLSPDFKSVMDELLARRTKIPVVLVEDGMQVEKNRIYLIPARKEMIISGGRLLLSDRAASGELTLPIDIFFRSLAEDVGARAIAIVLSGAGSDGARGIRDVHDAGGMIIVQDESTANFNGMPRSACDTGVVDHVAPPKEIPKILMELALRPAPHEIPESLNGKLKPHGVGAALRLLQDAYGIDFSQYKPSTVVRRLERRLQMARAPTLEAYVERLGNDSEELDALFRDLLIGVTRFFRDDEAFELFERNVVPELIERLPAGEEARIWIAGCATGEEAYSIAILFQEQLRKTGDRRRIKILATDVHRRSLDFASVALYEEERVAHIRPDLLGRYFDKRGPNYQVSPEIRQLVVFASHNVIKDAPFTRLDLICCRNLLIYLQPLAQKKVLSLFRFGLKRHGVLFLGPSENLSAVSEDFETLNGHWRIYRKQNDARLPKDLRITSPRVPLLQGVPGTIAATYSLSQVMGVYDALLEEHMRPSLLVNERRELVHTFAGASRYLRIRDGRPSLDVFDMLAPDLRVAVTDAVQRAMTERTTIVYNGLKLAVGDEEWLHKVSVKPVAVTGAAQGHVLITIEPMDRAPAARSPEAEVDLNEISNEHLSSMEAELRRTRENLQATIEELETSNEELQAANEELLASNEELQSTNEELQSVNEELYTVNSEYQKKITELTQLTHDMDNLLASIQVGTIFLDQQLRIRRFTPLIAEAFDLLPQDIGRPIAGFSTTLHHPGLVDDLKNALQSQRPIEREVCDGTGNWFFLRILPYRARGAVDGVVLTLIDINGLKAAEDAMFRERYLLNSLIDSVPDVIYFKDARGRFVRVNKSMANRLGLDDPTEAVGKLASDFLSDSEAHAFDGADQPVLGGEAQSYRQEQYAAKDGELSWFMTTRQPLRDRIGNVVGMLAVARDVTEQKRAEDEIRLAVTRRDEFLAMLSHELRNPLAAIVNATMLLQQTEESPQAKSRQAVRVIDRQSRQMARLLDDLLEVSRVTQKKIELRRRIIDIRTVLEEAVVATREKFVERQVVLSVEAGREPVFLDADPARLQQIIVNLLDNASKYSRPGARAAISLESEGHEAVLKVTDDGAGIHPSLLETIFEPFVQGRATLDRTGGGMGLGLTLVRSLVQMHGGNIVAHSNGLDKGSAFVVRLPLASMPADAATLTQKDLRWPEGKRIVVIEDNLDNCETLKLLLERAGYEVFTAADGKSGLDTIERLSPDIAIVDVGLPEMNGFELARHVRSKLARPIYMVALTGYGQAADHAMALEAGFDEHLVKPLHPDELTRLMRTRRRNAD